MNVTRSLILGSALASAPRTHGMLVTVTEGSNSNLPLSRSAVWLWRRCSHQWATTYSGMKIETTSPGCSRRNCLT